MQTRAHRSGVGALALLLGLVASPLLAQDRPNVLFIAVDDLVPTLGCYGDPVALTPSIDSLAAQGMTFLNHHCQWAVCGPSRAAMATSLMPEETGVMGFKPIRAILPDVITLPQHFKNQGYETAGTGKFYDPRTVGTITDPNGPTEKDTDDLPSWSLPYVTVNGGFGPAGNPAVDGTDQPDQVYTDHLILTEGLALIDTLAAGDKPFFLAVGFKKPHLPLVAPKRFWDLYDRNSMPLAAFTGLPLDATTYTDNTLTDNDELLGYEPYDTTGLPTEAQQRELLHGYYACASMIDEFVGRLRDKLASTDDPLQPGKKLSDTTIVVLWGDHGFHLGDHGRWAKHSVMEQGTRCPLILFDPRNPTAPGANTTTSPANSMDIYPTLCEMAGIPVPEQPLSGTVPTGRPLRGRSLVPVYEDPGASVHAGAISQFSINGQYGYSYRTERFRYVEWIASNGTVNGRDLYDYDRDPLETRNVAGDPAYAAIVHQLARSMRAETTTNGTGRLNLAEATSAGSDADLPDVSIAPAGASGVKLEWPAAEGVTYAVRGSADLAPGPWAVDAGNVDGDSAVLPMVGARRFFRVGFDANIPPVFVQDPLTRPTAYAGIAYVASLSGMAEDAGDSLGFSKLSGPGWLVVGADGSLSGTPAAGDAGANYFTVAVSDSAGASARATLQVTVLDPSANGPPAFVTDPIVKADAVVGVPYAGSLAGDADDPDAGQALSFTKVSGPDWLSVSPDGELGGTPSAGDLGLVPFTVRVADPLGASADAELQVTVVDAPSGTVGMVAGYPRSADQGNALSYGSTFFAGVNVQAGDVLVLSHANNKGSGNVIDLGGLGTNAVTATTSTSGSASAWIFHSRITEAGSFDLVLDTSQSNKSVSQASTLYLYRASSGSLVVLTPATASMAGGSATLDLVFDLSPGVLDAVGVAAASISGAGSAFTAPDPSGWTVDLRNNSKRLNLSNADLDGTTHTATFSAEADTDMAAAGIVVTLDSP